MADTKAPGIIEGLMIVRGVTRAELAGRIGVTRQAVFSWFRAGFTDANVRRCLKALDAAKGAYDRCGVPP